MTTTIRACVLSALLLSLGACSENHSDAADGKSGATSMTDQAKQGAAAATAAVGEAWDKLSGELATQSVALKTQLANATPETKAKIQGFVDSFNKHMETAKKKFEEAKSAAPDQVAALKKQGQEAYDAAAKAYKEATSK